MAYIPGTKLCYAEWSQRCTVLTDGNVMVTKGLSSGNVLKLADWLILADGNEMTESAYLSEKEALAKVKLAAEEEMRAKNIAKGQQIQAQARAKAEQAAASARAIEQMNALAKAQNIARERALGIHYTDNGARYVNGVLRP